MIMLAVFSFSWHLSCDAKSALSGSEVFFALFATQLFLITSINGVTHPLPGGAADFSHK